MNLVLRLLVLMGACIAAYGLVSKPSPKPLTFQDSRRLPQANEVASNLALSASLKPVKARTRTAQIERTTLDFLTGKIAPVTIANQRTIQQAAERLAELEQRLHDQEAALRKAEQEQKLREEQARSTAADQEQRLAYAQALREAAIKEALEEAAAADEIAEAAQDRRMASLDTKYFRGSTFAGCAKRCEPNPTCLASPDGSPKPPVALRRIEEERIALERIRGTIETDYVKGRLAVEHYKRLLTRYQCGIRVYQTEVSHSLKVAG